MVGVVVPLTTHQPVSASGTVCSTLAPRLLVPRYVSRDETDVPVVRVSQEPGKAVCEARWFRIQAGVLQPVWLFAVNPPGGPEHLETDLTKYDGSFDIGNPDIERDVVFLPVSAFRDQSSGRVSNIEGTNPKLVTFVSAKPIGPVVLGQLSTPRSSIPASTGPVKCKQWSRLGPQGWTKPSPTTASGTFLYRCGSTVFLRYAK